MQATPGVLFAKDGARVIEAVEFLKRADRARKACSFACGVAASSSFIKSGMLSPSSILTGFSGKA